LKGIVYLITTSAGVVQAIEASQALKEAFDERGISVEAAGTK